MCSTYWILGVAVRIIHKTVVLLVRGHTRHSVLSFKTNVVPKPKDYSQTHPPRAALASNRGPGRVQARPRADLRRDLTRRAAQPAHTACASWHQSTLTASACTGFRTTSTWYRKRQTHVNRVDGATWRRRFGVMGDRDPYRRSPEIIYHVAVPRGSVASFCPRSLDVGYRSTPRTLRSSPEGAVSQGSLAIVENYAETHQVPTYPGVATSL